MNEMNENVLETLQGEKIVALATTDAEEEKQISIHAISWLLATDDKTIRFAVDSKSKILINIAKNENVSLSFFARGSFYEVRGQASLRHKQLPDVPLKMSCVEVKVNHVREAMFYGAKVTQEPVYEKTYRKQLADEYDGKVYWSLRNC